MAITTPRRLKSKGKGSLMKPSSSKERFTRPLDCSSTIQAAERTKIEVQKGTSTRIIRMLAWRGVSVDNQ